MKAKFKKGDLVYNSNGLIENFIEILGTDNIFYVVTDSLNKINTTTIEFVDSNCVKLIEKDLINEFDRLLLIELKQKGTQQWKLN